MVDRRLLPATSQQLPGIIERRRCHFHSLPRIEITFACEWFVTNWIPASVQPLLRLLFHCYQQQQGNKNHTRQQLERTTRRECVWSDQKPTAFDRSLPLSLSLSFSGSASKGIFLIKRQTLETFCRSKNLWGLVCTTTTCFLGCPLDRLTSNEHDDGPQSKERSAVNLWNLWTSRENEFVTKWHSEQGGHVESVTTTTLKG